MSKALNRHFSKENIEMVNRHMKRYSTSLIIREMQIKTTVMYYQPSIRKATPKKSTDNKFGCGIKAAVVRC